MWERKWFQAVCLFAGWTLIGIIFATQLYLFGMNSGWNITWSYVVRWDLSRWCLWAVLTPWIVWLARIHPIQRPHLGSRLIRHGLMSILVSLAHVTLFSLVYWLLVSLEGGSELDLLELFEVFTYAFPLDFHLGIFVYWSIPVLLLTIQLYRNATQLQLQLTNAQLQALKMQIHPHFLFNTLNSISALLHKDLEAADEMVGSLGDFLRFTLQNSGAEEVRLEKEIEFLKCYLAIEQIRFRDRLIANFELEAETLGAMVPNMLFQPIIENAIKHGIADRTDLGHIEIRARRHDGRLRVTIKDDGPGLENGSETVVREGIGVKNTRARLNHLYGADHRFLLENVPGGGLLVTVEIPFIPSEQSAQQEEFLVQNTNPDRG